MQKIRGLYKITNECTGLFYIGKSTDIYKRWVNHKRDFEKGTHAGGAFQYDYDLFGKEAFKYEVLYENNSIITKKLPPQINVMVIKIFIIFIIMVQIL